VSSKTIRYGTGACFALQAEMGLMHGVTRPFGIPDFAFA
jgi:hypothetical protein